MATAKREGHRVSLSLSKHEAEVLRGLTGHLSFGSPGT